MAPPWKRAVTVSRGKKTSPSEWTANRPPNNAIRANKAATTTPVGAAAENAAAADSAGEKFAADLPLCKGIAMKRLIILIALSPLLAACGETRTVVYDNSVNAQFARMMGGTAAGSDSSGQWTISSGGNTANPALNDPNHPVSPGALRIAELIRNLRANPNAPAPTLSDGTTNNSAFHVTSSFGQPDPGQNSAPDAPPPTTGPAVLPMGTWNTPAP